MKHAFGAYLSNLIKEDRPHPYVGDLRVTTANLKCWVALVEKKKCPWDTKSTFGIHPRSANNNSKSKDQREVKKSDETRIISTIGTMARREVRGTQISESIKLNKENREIRDVREVRKIREVRERINPSPPPPYPKPKKQKLDNSPALPHVISHQEYQGYSRYPASENYKNGPREQKLHPGKVGDRRGYAALPARSQSPQYSNGATRPQWSQHSKARVKSSTNPYITHGTNAPPTNAPPTNAPPTNAPPTNVPPTNVPPTNALPVSPPPYSPPISVASSPPNLIPPLSTELEAIPQNQNQLPDQNGNEFPSTDPIPDYQPTSLLDPTINPYLASPIQGTSVHLDYPAPSNCYSNTQDQLPGDVKEPLHNYPFEQHVTPVTNSDTMLLPPDNVGLSQSADSTYSQEHKQSQKGAEINPYQGNF